MSQLSPFDDAKFREVFKVKNLVPLTSSVTNFQPLDQVIPSPRHERDQELDAEVERINSREEEEEEFSSDFDEEGYNNFLNAEVPQHLFKKYL